MHDRETPRRPEPPLVGRPRGEAWQSLQSDGVAWEGQVFLVGDDSDLSARLILTTNRIAFARSGDVILEAPRTWLRPVPRLRAADEVLLSIAAPGSTAEPPVTLALRMREGEEAAEHLVWLLGGVVRHPVVEPAPREAAPASVPEFDAYAPHRDGPHWPDDAETAPDLSPRPVRPDYPVHADPAAAAIAAAERMEGVVRQSAPPVASGDTRDWNLPMREYVVPRSQRRGRWGWAARLTALVSLLTVAAGLGAGRIPLPIDQLGRSAALATATPSAAAAVAAVAPTEQPAQISDQPAIGGPSGPVEPAPLPGNRPAADIQLQARPGQGTTETWAEPTAAPPPPAAVAAIPDAASQAVEAAQPAAPEPAATIAPEPTATPEPAPTATPEPLPTTAPEPAAAQPTATAQPEPTATAIPPTATPEPEPTATPEPEPTATPEPTPTATPVPEPTATAPAAEPTAAPEPAEAAQPASEQALAVTVRLATGGQTLPEFGLPPSPSGNWMVVVADLVNDGAEAVEAPLQSFSLRTSAGDAPLDPSADLAATIAGIAPAWAADDTIVLQPGEATRALLLFQVDPAANDMTLAGPGVEAPIADALAAGGSVAMLPPAP